MPANRFAIACYQGLLRLYPAEFRDEFARELCLVLRDRLREQRSSPGRTLAWIDAALAVLVNAPKEHYHVIMHDLKYALRILRKDAMVTAFAVAILALGIGASTLVFSLANGLLVRPLPWADSDRLVTILEHNPQAPALNGNVAFPNYHDIRLRAKLLSDIAVYSEQGGTIRGGSESEVVPLTLASDALFDVLGVRPLLGRTFKPEDDIPNGPRVVVLSFQLWQRRYGSDPSIVGKTIQLGDATSEVIGVMPAGFHFPRLAEAWVPLQMNAATASRADFFLEAVGRLKPGATHEQASA